MKFVEENGRKLHLNVDLLRDTKHDPKVGALIIDETRIVRDLALFSDFCNPKNTE